MYRKKLAAALVAGVCFFAAFPAANAAEKEDGRHIEIYYTGSMEGRVLATDEAGRSIGMARIAAAIRQAKDADEDTLAFDAGNIFSGTPLIDARDGAAMAPLLNLAGYDAAAIGSRDVSLGISSLVKLAARLNFPIVTANIIEKRSNDAVFLPYKVFNQNGVRIAVFGMIADGTQLAHDDGKELEVQDSLPLIKEMAMRLEENNDVVIALMDFGGGDATEKAEKADISGTVEAAQPDPKAKLMAEVPQLDLVIDGRGTAHGKALGHATVVVKDHVIVSKRQELLAKEAVQKLAPQEDDAVLLALEEIKKDAELAAKDSAAQERKSLRKKVKRGERK